METDPENRQAKLGTEIPKIPGAVRHELAIAVDWKKAKCDGTSNCRTCKINDSTCSYAVHRGRGSRNYYYRLRDITDEALRILYLACRQNDNFPGVLPSEDEQGSVSTQAILEGLGLVGPGLDENGYPPKLCPKPVGHKHNDEQLQGSNQQERDSSNSETSFKAVSKLDMNASSMNATDTKRPKAMIDSSSCMELKTCHESMLQIAPEIFSPDLLLNGMADRVNVLADMEHMLYYQYGSLANYVDIDSFGMTQ